MLGCCNDHRLETVDNRSEEMSSAHQGFLKKVQSFIFVVTVNIQQHFGVMQGPLVSHLPDEGAPDDISSL